VADPLDVLHQPEVPVAPAPAFAAQLRRRLADLLGVDAPAGPTGTLRLRPYLVVDGADAAIEFYAAVFGARVVGDLIRGDDGRVGHSELEIDGSAFFLADAYPEYGILAPDPAVGVALHLEVADADATVARAAERGATVLQPVDDRFYGSRSGTVRDPFGHQWQIDAPGTVSTTAAEREQEMADGGYRYETVDLGDRAVADPPTRTEQAAATADAPGVGYYTIDAPDPARAAAFFGALLGWRAHPSGEGFHIENVSPPGGIDGSAAEPGVTLFIRVADVAASAARVRELGGTVLEEAVHPSGGNARCLDDQGVPFHLWQPAPGY
jgi:uncharacterized glyoxalase superfamily protein PhnB